jgi:hypothetical protein
MCIDRILLLTLVLFASFSFGYARVQEQPAEKDDDAYFQDNGPDLVKSIQVYPNPATHYLNVDIDETKLSSVSFEVYNIIGNAMQVKAEKVSNGQYRILVRNLAPGYYLLVVKDDYTRVKQTYKILKQ